MSVLPKWSRTSEGEREEISPDSARELTKGSGSPYFRRSFCLWASKITVFLLGQALVVVPFGPEVQSSLVPISESLTEPVYMSSQLLVFTLDQKVFIRKR